MANSSFKKAIVSTPVAPNKGGTGISTLTDKGVLVGAGTGNVTTVAPGTSGNVLKSDGTSWTSGVGVNAGDVSVSYSKLAGDLIDIIAMSTDNVDWSAGSIFTKTLTINTTLTFSNLQLDKNIILEITGDYTLALPSYVNLIGGTYDGTVANYITLHCTNATGASEQVWMMINQGSPIHYDSGYFAGGYATTYVAITDRIVFSTGATSANTVSNLSQARSNLAGLSDGSTNGYFAGGSSGTYVVTGDRIVFSTGTTSANTVSNLSQARYALAGVSDGSTNGYFAGGGTASLSIPVATTDRIVFSTGATSANTVSNLSQARDTLAGLSDGSTNGYFSGGNTSSSGSFVRTTDRIVFATGVTSANTVSDTPFGSSAMVGLSDGSRYGYFNVSAYNNYMCRIVFSTGATSANTVSNLSDGRSSLTSSSDCAV